MAPPARRWTPLAVLGIAAATAAAYGPALRGAMLWDDAAHVTPPALRGMAGLWRIWFHLGATQQYYPLLHTAFWAEHALWGDAVLGYHLLNVALHALSACLFALVLARIRPGRAGRGTEWFAAAVFALHPVCVESVAWISEQKNTLSLALYLLAALSYLRFDEGRRKGPYMAALVLFVMALLTKSVTATLPAALLLMLAWRRGRLSPARDAAPLIPFFAAGISAGLFTAWVERTYIGASGPDFALGLAERFLLAGRVVWFYLGKVLWPSGLMFIYPHWNVVPGLSWYAGVAAFAAAPAVLWRIRAWSPAPLLTFLFFVGSLFPALGFVNVYPFLFSYVADHFQYIACLGVIALVADGGLAVAIRRASAAGRPWGAALAAACAIALCILFGLTRRQAAAYRGPGTLYSETLRRNPGAWMAENNLGVDLMGRRDYAGAIAHFRRAISLRPAYADAHNNLGNALTKSPSGAPGAIAEFREALALQPSMAEAHANLGTALVAVPGAREAGIAELRAALRGNEDNPEFARAHADLGAALAAGPEGIAAAGPEFEKSLRLDPHSAAAWDNYGIALARAGRPAEAASCILRALALSPDEGVFHSNLGGVYEQLGKRQDAVREYREAVRLDPGFAGGHYNLGQELMRGGDLAGAEAELREAVRLSPGAADMRSSLGTALYRARDYSGAAAQYAEAVRIAPSSARYRNYLGIALGASGRPVDALRELREAVRLDPGYPDAHYNLALALRRAGLEGEAGREFERSGRPAPQVP
ncbi:MAG TPA: tetratricopeptide repeat protein [Opitutaceae bacterium]